MHLLSSRRSQAAAAAGLLIAFGTPARAQTELAVSTWLPATHAAKVAQNQRSRGVAR
jgi:hypothetical protein